MSSSLHAVAATEIAKICKAIGAICDILASERSRDSRKAQQVLIAKLLLHLCPFLVCDGLNAACEKLPTGTNEA